MTRAMEMCTAVSSLLLCIVVAVQGEFQCSVDSDNKLTLFTGESVALSLPCKYRLADVTCGDYRVKVTAGNDQIGTKRSSLAMWVKIKNKSKISFETRTSQKIFQRYLAGKTKDAWKAKSGSLDVVDVIGYDDSSKRLVIGRSGVFAVELSEQGEVTVRCLADHGQFSSLPQTLCGDGISGSLVLENGIASLSGENYQATAQDYVNFITLNDHTVTQSKTCKTQVNMFQSCDVKEKALTQCDVIMTDASLSQCLVKSGADPMDHFNNCLTSVCDGDESALETTNDFISANCEGVSTVGPGTVVEPTAAPEPETDPSCPQYKLLDDHTRDVNTGYMELCDQQLIPGWYRFILNETNAVMPTYCVPTSHCGTIGPYWLDLQGKELPAVGQQTVARACAHYSIYCCNHNIPVTVHNCGAFYVYKLEPTVMCDEAYCAEPQIEPTVEPTAAPEPGTDPSCPQYTLLDDHARDVNAGYMELCDQQLIPGWYRFILNETNAVMPTYCVPTSHCGTIGPYWLDLQGKELPAVGQETVARACAHYSIYCCNHNNPVTVHNCGAFYVYKLEPTVMCDEAYCAEPQIKPTVEPTAAPEPETDPSCPQYKLLDDHTRDVNTGYMELCDQQLIPGWYRFIINETNAVMPTYCVPTSHCGTIGPYWLDLQGKELPAVGQQTVARACAHYSIYCCNHNNPVTVHNCGAFYVYKLEPTVMCDEAYCAERVDA